MLAEIEVIQAYASSFSCVPLKDLNALLIADILQLRGSFNARNSFRASFKSYLSKLSKHQMKNVYPTMKRFHNSVTKRDPVTEA